MTEKDDDTLPIPQQEGQQDAGDATADANYRKAEEDSTMLKEEERAGEDTKEVMSDE